MCNWKAILMIYLLFSLCLHSPLPTHLTGHQVALDPSSPIDSPISALPPCLSLKTGPA